MFTMNRPFPRQNAVIPPGSAWHFISSKSVKVTTMTTETDVEWEPEVNCLFLFVLYG